MTKILKTFSYLTIFILSIFSSLFIVNAWDNDSWAILRNQDKSADNLKLCQFWTDSNWKCNVKQWLKEIRKTDWIEKDKTFFDYAQSVLSYLLWFVYILAVIYIIYAWFLLLMWTGDIIASWKARSNIIYVLVWVTVIFLANSIIVWLIGVLSR